jgi:hypothetical protein
MNRPEVSRNGAGWFASHTPYAAFDDRAQAEHAATLPVAEAYSYSIAVRTLATGARLLEWICEVKCRCPYMPYTAEERTYVDGLIAERIEERRIKTERMLKAARSITPAPPSGLDWLWKNYNQPQDAIAKVLKG